MLDQLNIYLVEGMDEVLKIALSEPLPAPLTATARRRRPSDAVTYSDDTRTH